MRREADDGSEGWARDERWRRRKREEEETRGAGGDEKTPEGEPGGGAGGDEEAPKGERCTVVSAHQDVAGEKELREFLTEKGFGHRKAYYWSCLADYKGPRSCRKLSKFLEQCGSIEVYVEGDGKQSIRLAAAFAPAA